MRNPFSKKHAEFRVRNEIEKSPVPICDIGAIGISGILNERVVPIIVADLRLRPDLIELIRIHQVSGPGDLNMQWGDPGREGYIRLIINFVRPIECLALFDFNIREYGSAVVAIFRKRALYLQSGTAQTKISDGPNAAKIFCEIPSVGAEPKWEKLYQKSLFREFRAKGLSRSEAKIASKKFIDENRSLDDAFSRRLGKVRR